MADSLKFTGVIFQILFLFFCLSSGSISGFSNGRKLIASSPTRRKLVGVQGVIYCKSCKYIGVDTLNGASPLPGATARLQCNSSKITLTAYGKSDKNGYFYIETPKVTTYGVHKCKLFLGSSSLATCNVSTNLNGGLVGAPLKFQKLLNGTNLVALYASGPFAFSPSNKVPCP